MIGDYKMDNNGFDPNVKEPGRPERTQIMTTKEIAKYLGVHEMTVYRWLKKGVLPGLKSAADGVARKISSILILLNTWKRDRSY